MAVSNRGMLVFVRLTLLAGFLLSSMLEPGVGVNASAAKPVLHCRDGRDVALPLSIRVEGQIARGRYAAPSGQPTKLLVINHGYNFDSHAWQWIMRDIARDHGVLVVAMDYRGTVSPGDFDGDGQGDYHDHDGARWDGSPRARGWPIAAGAVDTNAVTDLAQRMCSSIEQTVLFSVSMGVGAGGMALAESSGLYDYWFAVEGVSNLFEEYHGACAVARSGNTFAAAACEDIAAETSNGDPQELARRTLITRSREIGESGVRGAVIVHALEDGLAPYDQARQLHLALKDAEIPTEFFTVARRDERSERGTTVSSYAGNLDSGMAGHASEVSDTHINMRVAYERLWDLLDRNTAPAADREFIVDGTSLYPVP